MKRKNLSVAKPNDVFIQDKKIAEIYFKLSSVLSKYKKNNSFAAAISGGPDSMALAALSKLLVVEEKYRVHFLLVDHGIRKDSGKEALKVKRLLKKNKINLKILKNRKKITKNIQKTARDLRYELLIEFCRKNKIKFLITAHHKDDQVETFFIRLSRGSGLDGLSSMKQINKINGNIHLVRPLLDFKKIELIKVSKVIFGKFYKDPTNKNTKYLRTRIRNLKEPLETSGINYDQVFQSIKNLASSRDTLDLYFSKIYKGMVNKRKNKILINLASLNSLNQEMKMRVFKKSIKDFTNVYYSPRSKKIFNLINQIKTKKNAKLTLGGCIILREKNHIILKKENKN